MRLILIRHAPSLGQKDSRNYPKYGDPRVPLDPEHDYLTIKCGEFLTELFNQKSINKWPLFWTSRMLRSQQTFSGILEGVANYFAENSKPTWHIDPLLDEQSFGSIPYIETIKNPVQRWLAGVFNNLSYRLYKNDPFSSRTFMGDSPMDVLHHVRTWMDGTFIRDILEGEEDHVVVSHGAVMKAIAMHWFHLYGLDSWKDIETPGNCDVWVIEGEPKNWTLRKVYDGEKMENLLDSPLNPIEHVKRPNELPPPSLSSQT